MHPYIIRFIGGPYHGEDRVILKHVDYVFVPLNAKESAFVRYRVKAVTKNGMQVFDHTGNAEHVAELEDRVWSPDEVAAHDAKRHQGLLQDLLTQILPPSRGARG